MPKKRAKSAKSKVPAKVKFVAESLSNVSDGIQTQKPVASQKRKSPKDVDNNESVSEQSNTKRQRLSNSSEGVNKSEDQSAIVSGQSQSHLFRLPRELRDRIWTLCVQHDCNLAPRQICARSNKFTYSVTKQVRIWTLANGESTPDPMLDVVSLAATCHQIYDEVSTTDLFYKLNAFEFKNNEQMVNYLFAITPKRMRAITSVTVSWISWHHSFSSRTIVRRYGHRVLAACEGLKTLNLRFNTGEVPPDDVWGGRLVAAVGSLRGLKTLHLSLVAASNRSVSKPYQDEIDRLKILENQLNIEVTKPRESAVSLQMISDINNLINIDIVGEGRLAEDRKPGMVSSRTRSQLKKTFSLESGMLSETEFPKHDLEGNISWIVHEVLDSKRIKSDSDDELESIWLKVKWAGRKGESWEKLSGFGFAFHADSICDFFAWTPDAVGLEEALAFFKPIKHAYATLARTRKRNLRLKAYMAAVDEAQARSKAKEASKKVAKKPCKST